MIAAISIAPALIAYLAAVAIGRPPTGDIALSLSSLAFIIGFALAAGAVEEPGWRGVAQDITQAHAHPLIAAMFIGLLWVLWHLPLFFMEGSYQHDLGLLTPRFWHFNAALMLLSILYVWVCNGANVSILAAILLHAGTNIAGSLIPQDALTDLTRSIVYLIACLAVIGWTRGRLQLQTKTTQRPSFKKRS
jgi:uncharacterized protein